MSNRSPAHQLTCGGIAALGFALAPLLFFGIGSFLNWLL